MNMFTEKLSTFFLCAAVVLTACSTEKAIAESDLYGVTKPEDYLMGRFRPEPHALFSPVSEFKIPEKGARQYLRKEAAKALAEMLAAFQAEHPKVDFWITSSTRNWDSQKSIWEGKWNGRIHVEGKRLDKAYPDALKRARKILEYSSMPGTSRHHWGTDFDMNELYNDYYKTGSGKILYDWMQTNAAKYGFCQPYTAGREKGYHEERWHWSYKPLSKPLLDEWKKRLGEKAGLAEAGLFAGSEKAGTLAVEYVTSVNPDCQ
ncbi:MAG: M15 family metallopeptidase [Spirochaetia bacterium]|nr:M15 family metallopeptidase [Spirochaetia bacterium]